MSCGSAQSSQHTALPSLQAIEIPSPFAGWSRFARQLLRLYDRQQQRRLLLELDDRMLADIGRTREQAQVEGRKPFWR